MGSEYPWSPSEEVVIATPGSREPSMALVGETLHLTWNCNRALYHAWRTSAGWSQSIKIAIGEQPALGATPDGRLYCLFVNQFARNYEVYYIWWDGKTWSLPVNVSKTYGVSTMPALAIGPDSDLHATWADTTPGYSTVYYAARGSSFWANRPVPSGRGSAPTIAVTPDDSLFIAWQDRRSDTGVYDIFCTIYRDNIWSTPEIVSDSPDRNSLYPQLTIGSRGDCHLVWQEECDGLYRIFYAEHRPNGWTQPVGISQDLTDCSLARVAANPFGFVHVLWSDGAALNHRVKPVDYDASWRSIEAAAKSGYELAGIAFVISSARRAHLVWSALDDTGNWRLLYARREPLPKYTLLMPVVTG